MRKRRTDDPISRALLLRRAAAALMLALMLMTAGCGLQETDPSASFDALLQQAVSAYERGDAASAQRSLKTAARMGQERPDVYALIATRLSAMGRPTDATSFLVASLKDSKLSWDPMLWETLAQSATQSGDARRADAARVEAAARARNIMARIGVDAQEKKTPWKTAGEPFLRAGFYYLSESVRDIPAAVRALREALRREPLNPEMMNALGYTMADEGKTEADFREALDLTQEAVKRMPNNSAFVDSLGWALFKNNDLEGARRYLRQAVDMSPEQAELRYHLGVVLAELGDTQKAKLEFERAVRLKPDYKEAEDAIEHIKTRPGEGVVQGA